jgi:hypothetical protein
MLSYYGFCVIFVKFGSHAGIAACLFFNIIATTTAWIKGEGISEA